MGAAGPTEHIRHSARNPEALNDAQRTAASAKHLVLLLSTRPENRERWQRYMRRQSRGPIHQGAVAQVLAAHLWDSGEVSDTDVFLPRRLKDIVSRALSGQVLAPVTLRWFIEAFAMSPMDAAHLWALRSGRDPARLAIIRDDLATPMPTPPGRPRYHTVSLHEFHTVGADRLPVAHRTVHVVRAVDELRRYPYRFDTDAATVEVLRGGTASPLYWVPEDGLYGVDILLQRPLQPGQTASFEYRTLFSYRTPPPPEFRRGARKRVDNVELHVQFHPRQLPVQIWWGIWNDHKDLQPTYEEPAELEPDGSIHRYLDSLEGHVVGFRWHFTGSRARKGDMQ